MKNTVGGQTKKKKELNSPYEQLGGVTSIRWVTKLVAVDFDLRKPCWFRC
jgi:hypothetical protein